MSIALLLSVAVINFSPAFSDSDDVYRSKTSDDYVPCERGWYYFRDNCYKIAERRRGGSLSWDRALALCRSYGADLVSIHSQEEQDFIVAYLQLDVKSWVWTGLNDREKEGEFKWSDGSVFKYSHWSQYEPSGRGIQPHAREQDEDCVHLLHDYTDKDTLGKWNDRHCGVSEYALCKMKANPRKKSPNLKYCSPEEGGGWKYENSCFHIVTEMTSWQDAERLCKNNYNGHLLTIRDALQDFFLELAFPDIKTEFWIGIKIQDQLQQKWTSGWYVSYDRFNKDERYKEDTCVARKKRKEWKTLPCATPLPFICEASKDRPPVLNPPPKGAHCPQDLDDWRDLGGDYCYYISEILQEFNFYQTNFQCQRRGGHMLSLHSEEEANILHPFIKYKIPDPDINLHRGFYIGLIRLMANNGENFGWTDGSKFSYQNWQHNEPNNHDEKCVEINPRSMKWNDVKCENSFLGYICSVKKIIPSSSHVEESANCKHFCIAPYSYLYGLISQCPDAEEIS